VTPCEPNELRLFEPEVPREEPASDLRPLVVHFTYNVEIVRHPEPPQDCHDPMASSLLSVIAFIMLYLFARPVGLCFFVGLFNLAYGFPIDPYTYLSALCVTFLFSPWYETLLKGD
jgi:hypothetical protein